MDFTEASLYEIMGLTPPSGEGENGQGAAALGGTSSGSLAPPQAAGLDPSAAPPLPTGTATLGSGGGPGAEETAEEPSESGSEAERRENGAERMPGESRAEQSEVSPDAGGKPAQTAEQRRENAARRRQAETQAAVDQAVAAEREKHQKELADFFQAASLKNTITGKPITSMEEFNAWKQDFAAAKLQRELKAGKLTPEALNQAIAQNPAVQQVQQMARESEEAKRRAAEAEAKVRIDAELKEIGKMDPTIKGPEDLLKMPKAKEFYAYVKRGFSFLEAYKMANFDTLTTRTAEAARQQAMTNARGKNHLTGTRQQGAGALTVPADELAMFRAFNPDATDEQIQDFYNKDKRK